LKLQTSATVIDYFPAANGKRFVKRTVWHPGAESEMTTFSTVIKSDMIYDVNQYINNGASVLDFNLNEYAGQDYSSLAC